MTSVRRALAGRTVFLLAAAGAVLLAPYARRRSAVSVEELWRGLRTAGPGIGRPDACNGPKYVATIGWLTRPRGRGVGVGTENGEER
jgi:hypothetical protein